VKQTARASARWLGSEWPQPTNCSRGAASRRPAWRRCCSCYGLWLLIALAGIAGLTIPANGMTT